MSQKLHDLVSRVTQVNPWILEILTDLTLGPRELKARSIEQPMPIVVSRTLQREIQSPHVVMSVTDDPAPMVDGQRAMARLGV